MNYSPPGNPHQIYRAQQVSTLSPGRLVLLAYDTALRACRTGQRGLLMRVIQELVAGLDLDQGEIAVGLLRLYEYILREVREGRLEEAESHLRDLRETWARALSAEEARSAGSRPAASLSVGA